MVIDGLRGRKIKGSREKKCDKDRTDGEEVAVKQRKPHTLQSPQCMWYVV